jgi:hypothetical protein
MRNSPRYIPNTRVGGNRSQFGHFKEEKIPWPRPAIKPQLLGQTICIFVTLQKELILLLSLLSAASNQVFQLLVEDLGVISGDTEHASWSSPQQKFLTFNRAQNT